MRPTSLAFRLTAATALAGILTGAITPAFAQTSSLPPLPGQQAALGGPSDLIPTAGDPPARVGRVARIGGTVSFHTADADHWEPATLNEPVTSGNAFWTQPGASSDLEIGSARIVLDQTSEFTVDQLDDQNFVATASQGRMYLRLRNIAPGETNTIRTPRGTVVIGAPGQYEIVVGDTETPTLVTVHEGAATITGPGVGLSIGEHQTAQVSGGDNFSGLVVAEVTDNFMQGQLDREHPPRAYGNVAPPPVVQQMTGYEAVADTGVWDETPDYGRIWYPPVETGWAPYRDGHWAFVAPWGWTWVDDAPWGFAPFHYGRWVQYHDRWGWIPVAPGVYVESRPVYSPALVAFVGAGVGVAVGLGIAAAVGWIPLGPREVYRPPYRVSPGYMQRVNVTNVTNITTINNYNGNAPGNYVNAHAATMAPGAAFQQSQSLRGGVARPVPQGQLSSFQPVSNPAVTPTIATHGVTPGVARSMNLPPSSTPVVPRTSPGPAFQPHPSAVMPGTAAPVGAPPQVPHPGGGGISTGAALGVGAAVGAAAVVGGAALLRRNGNGGPSQPGQGPVGGSPGGLPQIAPHGVAPAPSQPNPAARFGGNSPSGGPPSQGSVPQYQRPAAPVPSGGAVPTPAPTPVPTPAPYQPRPQGVTQPNQQTYQPRPVTPPQPAYQPSNPSAPPPQNFQSRPVTPPPQPYQPPQHSAPPPAQPQYQPHVAQPAPFQPPAPRQAPPPPSAPRPAPSPPPPPPAQQHHACPPGQPRC